jgi:hypothetical protein
LNLAKEMVLWLKGTLKRTLLYEMVYTLGFAYSINLFSNAFFTMVSNGAMVLVFNRVITLIVYAVVGVARLIWIDFEFKLSKRAPTTNLLENLFILF